MSLRLHHPHPQPETSPRHLSDDLEPEIRNALRDWRGHMGYGSELAEPFDPERDHVCGQLDAPVVVIEYGEVASAAESKEDRSVRERLRGLLDEGRICLVFRHFPIIDSHPRAWIAAHALEAADCQGRFWDLHDALTKSATEPWTGKLDRPAILAVARRLELDVERLETDMVRSSTTQRILRDLYSGFRSGVNGAPTYYVQGLRQDIEGPDELLERIEHALDGDTAALWPPLHARKADKAHAVRLWHDGLATGDLSGAAQHWHEQIDWRGWNEELPGGGSACGRKAVEELHSRPRAAPAGFRAQAREYIESGDRMLVFGEASGGAPSGAFRVPYAQLWEFDAGKAKRVDTLTDTLAIANALRLR